MGRGRWKLLEVRGRGGRGRGRPGARARARARAEARGRGRGHRGRAELVTAPGPSLAPPRAAHTAGGQGAGEPAASPSSASPGTARGRAARAAGARRAERQAGHGHHQHHGLHPAAAPQQRRAAAHRPGTRGGPAGVAPSPPPLRPCAIRAGAGTRGTGCGEGRPLRGVGDPPVIVREPSPPAAPPRRAHPAPIPAVPVQPGGAPGTDVRACMPGPAARHGRSPTRVVRAPGTRRSGVPKPLAVRVGTGIDGVERLCFGEAQCLCPARVAPNAPRGSRMDVPQWRVH